MEKGTTIQNFKNLVGNNKSNFIENIKASLENREWQSRSQDIAFIVLEKLAELEMKQYQLADKMNVTAQQISKILKGAENLTLESISKLENALGIKLININHEYLIPKIETLPQKRQQLYCTMSNKFTKEPKLETIENENAKAA
jgi:plasmid maintenance system antidote protein VapI